MCMNELTKVQSSVKYLSDTMIFKKRVFVVKIYIRLMCITSLGTDVNFKTIFF